MPRGGYRPGAGRRPNPDSANQKRLAARAAKQAAGAPAGEAVPAKDPAWPFGADQALIASEAAAAEIADRKTFASPMEFWQHVLADPSASVSAKQAAAYSLAPYVHPKLAPAAKKEDAKNRSKSAAGGKYAAARAPVLAVANGKRV
jgi:hypothetical protein